LFHFPIASFYIVSSSGSGNSIFIAIRQLRMIIFVVCFPVS